MKFINPPDWQRPSGYSNGTLAGGMLFVAGQVGWDKDGRFAPEFAGQVRQALLNVRAVVEAAGARCDQIARLTWYVVNRETYKAHISEIGAAYRDVLGRHYPAMSVVAVASLLEDEAEVEIEATVVF